MPLQLEINERTGKTQTVQLSAPEILIGRSATCAVSLAPHSVSRHHCVIRRCEPQGHVVQDCGSRNGTFLNGKRMFDACQLHIGDELEVGTVQIKVCRPSEGDTAKMSIDDPELATIIDLPYLEIEDDQSEGCEFDAIYPYDHVFSESRAPTDEPRWEPISVGDTKIENVAPVQPKLATPQQQWVECLRALNESHSKDAGEAAARMFVRFSRRH